MRFLVIQIIIVILVFIFVAALANLTELGFVGWIIAGSTGHGLYRIYKHMHYSMKSASAKRSCPSCNSGAADLSEQIQTFMFDDATELRDE